MQRIEGSLCSITKCGRVYNRQGKELSPSLKQGYRQAHIKQYGVMRKVPVHRLVALAYIPKQEGRDIVNHIDGNKQNNHYSNLEWCTPRENSIHARDVLGIGIGENHSQAILTDEVVHKICASLQDGLRNIDIAKMYNTTTYTVKSIRTKRSWTSVSKGYEISKSRVDNISDTTFLWVCHCLEAGLSTKEILLQSKSKGLDKHTISKIRNRKIRPQLSSPFSW